MQPKPSWYRAGSLGVAAVTFAALSVLTVNHAPARTPAIAHSNQAAPRILLLYDLEGASGVLSGATMNPIRPDSFATGRESLIEDVNAVVGGLFGGGAAQVHIENMHGSGGDSLIPRNRLDARAELLAGDRKLRPYALGPGPLDPGYGDEIPRPPYDAVVTVAMHDKPMSGGFSPHTLGAGVSPIMDGRAVTETELVGYAFGMVGIPVIFSSGDDRLHATLSTAMPWVEYAIVKLVTSPTKVRPLPRQAVRRALHDGAARAVRLLAQPSHMRVMRLATQSRAGLLTSYPRLLPPGMGSLPGIEKRGDTVTFAARDYRSAYWGMFVLMRIANALLTERVLAAVQGDSIGRLLVGRARDSINTRAVEFEAGKWTPR